MRNDEENLDSGKLKIFAEATYLVSCRDNISTRFSDYNLYFFWFTPPIPLIHAQISLSFLTFHYMYSTNYIQNQVSVWKTESSLGFGLELL